MNAKDSNLIYYINKHYQELLEETEGINSLEMFMESDKKTIKAVEMDLFQIGENFGKLSSEILSNISKKDIKGIVDIRNHIAHGYVSINESIIWDTIQNDLPKLIQELNNEKRI